MDWDELDLPATVENFAYYRLSLVNHTFDSNSRLCPLDNGRHSSLVKVGLGNLDKLPPEILAMVLGQLDIQTLTKFRRVNRRAMQAVDLIRVYQQIVTRFPTALRAILSISTGATYSCQDLYHELQTPECRSCGRFGAFLYLLTCRRVCASCFAGESLYIPFQASDLPLAPCAHDLATLPSMRTIPGHYIPANIPYTGNLILYDFLAWIKEYDARYGLSDAVRQPTEHRDLAERTQCRQEAELLSSRKPRNTEALRFMAVIRAPVFNGPDLEWGVHCLGCKRYYPRFDGDDAGMAYTAMMFEPEEFEEHVEKHVLYEDPLLSELLDEESSDEETS
jgi:hypothetical protein